MSRSVQRERGEVGADEMGTSQPKLQLLSGSSEQRVRHEDPKSDPNPRSAQTDSRATGFAVEHYVTIA